MVRNKDKADFIKAIIKETETQVEKCDGCKRNEGTDSVYTCNCNVKREYIDNLNEKK